MVVAGSSVVVAKVVVSSKAATLPDPGWVPVRCCSATHKQHTHDFPTQSAFLLVRSSWHRRSPVRSVTSGCPGCARTCCVFNWDCEDVFCAKTPGPTSFVSWQLASRFPSLHTSGRAFLWHSTTRQPVPTAPSPRRPTGRSSRGAELSGACELNEDLGRPGRVAHSTDAWRQGH
jgi:hypothetical protein